MTNNSTKKWSDNISRYSRGKKKIHFLFYLKYLLYFSILLTTLLKRCPTLFVIRKMWWFNLFGRLWAVSIIILYIPSTPHTSLPYLLNFQNLSSGYTHMYHMCFLLLSFFGQRKHVGKRNCFNKCEICRKWNVIQSLKMRW